jgi:quinoprotein glucose dehydrogenase
MPAVRSMLRSAVCCALLFSFARGAAAYPANFVDATFVTGLSEPIALAWSPDGTTLFIAQRGGAVKVRVAGVVSTALTLSVQLFEEQGLLGMALHPDFPNTPYVYLLYTPGSNPQDHGFQRISRFTWNPTAKTLGSELILHSTLPTGLGYHVAGCLRTTRDGYLYATDGENGDGGVFAQDLTHPAGKMIRLTLAGTIPASNPFVFTPSAWTVL